VMVILLFLRNFWATVIPGLTVPLALLGSAAGMYLLGFSLDNLSLMALTIAVGFVVDDAIVVVENIHRHVENGEAPFEAALTGAREIGFTVLSISMSLIAVFIPLLLMGGIIGRLFREFALTVTASIAVSALVSLTLAPMLCARFMRPQSHDHGRIYRFIEAGFDAMLSFYRSTLDIVLRHQPITLCLFFATMALTGAMMYYTPKGFFPIQDIDLITGIAEASQDVSPQKMISLEIEVDRIILGDPAVDKVVTSFGPSFGNTGNIERLNVILKPREERDVNASQVIDRLRPQLAKIVGVTTYLQPAQDITVGGRVARAAFQYTLQDPNIQELTEWSTKLLAKMKTLPEIADVGTDLLSGAPQLKVTINRDQAGRFGITPQAIDDTLNDAFGQRQITQYFTQLNTYFVILEVLPEMAVNLDTLDHIYVKSPLTGAAVPLSALVEFDSHKVGALSINHQGQFPAATITFNLSAGVALGEAVDAISRAAAEIGMPESMIGTFQGNAQAFQSSLSSEPAGRCSPRRRLHYSRDAVRKLHPSVDHSFDIAFRRRRCVARAEPGAHGPLSHRHHRHHSLDRHRQEERHHAGRLRHRGGARAEYAADCRDPRSLPVAVPADPDDDGSSNARRLANDVRPWDRIRTSQAARLFHGRRPRSEPTSHALYDACGLSLPCPPAGLDTGQEGHPFGPCRGTPRGRSGVSPKVGCRWT
jgi:multidrug efflux pump subunit AcrB